jgi:DNA-binding NarL/FixJ family response regulator
MLEGLRAVLERSNEFVFVGGAHDLGTALSEAETLRPDILIVGQPHAARTMLPVIAELRNSSNTARIVLWVGEISDVESFRALQMGARGVVRKTQPPEMLLECLRTVARSSVWIDNSGRSSLNHSRRQVAPRITRREREIIAHICRGMKNKEIAESLSITPGTVKVHLMHIFEKTGVKDRLQLALNGPQLLSELDAQNSDTESAV